MFGGAFDFAFDSWGGGAFIVIPFHHPLLSPSCLASRQPRVFLGRASLARNGTKVCRLAAAIQHANAGAAMR
jgi:hypothetical protein